MITSRHPEDENDFDQPLRVHPEEQKLSNPHTLELTAACISGDINEVTLSLRLSLELDLKAVLVVFAPLGKGSSFAGNKVSLPSEPDREVSVQDEADDKVSELPATTGDTDELVGPPPNYNHKRRGSVSAEATPLGGVPAAKKVVRKSLDAGNHIRNAIRHCFLFTELEEEQKTDVVNAMFRKDVTAGETIIREGEEGDNFYVIQEGHFRASKRAGATENVLFQYDGKGAFGELALMYNCPRAATVEAVTDGVLWAMDRTTFRNLVVVSFMEKRQRYERVLADMPIFRGLTPENRSVIADCLALEVYQDGDRILMEGEPLQTTSKFYLVECGTIECFKTFEGERKLVKTIADGGFFGEVAMVQHETCRAADCVAKGYVKVLTMGRDAFERLMGPAETILADQIADYAQFNAEAAGSHQQAIAV
ncbi:hypothetical protein WJX72_000322 [[Myrmecia] bisecta]|uniref:Cyclic nucleotide-binding domain-containing protein n=1 Tax=[Myrmecia] bisecta TaxID=41462 RepID=A0AAW1PWW3_9CHLO